MIEFIAIEREALDARSSGDQRKRVDAYFVAYRCPADRVNPDGAHVWICRFEVARRSNFKPCNYATKAEAIAARRFRI